MESRDRQAANQEAGYALSEVPCRLTLQQCKDNLTSQPQTTMDEFAQSREDDDLFADEFEPVDESTEIAQATPSTNTNTNTNTNPASPPTTPAKNGRPAQDRRPRGGGRGGANGLSQSRYAPQTETAPPVPAPAPSQDLSTPAEAPTPTPIQPLESTPTPTPAAAAAQAPTPARTHAVRGDRSLTGGTLPKKLTEEELTAKLAQMAILNAQKSESHRKSEADQAAFQHREAELKVKKEEERKNSRQMEMERAKNRQRKMQAQGGREWDSEKVESDIVDAKSRGRSSEYVRGGHGGVIRGRGAGLAGSNFADEEVVGDGPSRGRGGFERGGRGRGRGGRGGRGGGQSVPVVEDFPSLPTSSKAEEKTKSPSPSKVEAAETPTPSKEEDVKSPAREKSAHDWAEEMATPVEEKKQAEILDKTTV
ncbi:hypothetical protein LOCC1_G007713 [Lachnellula occidentalis]|uniref:Uncharacterized protein n=1 Tax=Lachnellula occidentalis TaxID=215460 RepID=A0A8H8RSX2_9HELO|nr:hypothetical protein LOCC1_G007713 [Lachnellula occidentalis]